MNFKQYESITIRQKVTNSKHKTTCNKKSKFNFFIFWESLKFKKVNFLHYLNLTEYYTIILFIYLSVFLNERNKELKIRYLRWIK